MESKQKKAYLKDQSKCPFCKSSSLSSEVDEFTGKKIIQITECMKCKKSWRTFYDAIPKTVVELRYY